MAGSTPASSGHRRWAAPLALALVGIGAGMVAGCLTVDAFNCETDLNCVFQGVSGRCVFPDQVCAYPDPTCPGSPWSTADGRCVVVPDAPPDATDGSETGPRATSEPGTSGGPMPLDDSSSSGPPDPTTGDPPGTTTDEPMGCVGPMDDITGLGVAEASSVFDDNFQAYLSVDGNFATSWFSSGPEPGNLPTIYTWSVLDPHCIAQVTITGNGLHSNQNFQEQFGFENMVLRVYDQDDTLMFQQMYGMGGTPDPPVLAFPGVWGTRVELELFDHESDNCGGFSELEIVGT